MITIEEKYVRNGWPALDRPDLQAPPGWSLDLITSVNRIYNPKLSPDGSQIAFLWKREGLADIYRLSLAAPGSWPERLTFNRKSKPYWWDETPQWSPDGQSLAFTLNDHVHVLGPDSGLPVKLSGFASGASSPVWMPDSGSLIVTIEVEDSSKLFLIGRDGHSARLLTHGSGDDLDARPSPDGKTVAYVHAPADDPNRWELRLLDLDSGASRQLTGSPSQKDWSPRWSPDGSWIAFLSQRSGFNEAWLIGPDGSDLRQLIAPGLDMAGLAWSPDGRRIACTLNRGGSFDLVVIEVENGSRARPGRRQGYLCEYRLVSPGRFPDRRLRKPRPAPGSVPD